MHSYTTITGIKNAKIYNGVKMDFRSKSLVPT